MPTWTMVTAYNEDVRRQSIKLGFVDKYGSIEFASDSLHFSGMDLP